MSSNYHVLCLSHDPSLVVGEYGNRPEPALEAIGAGIEGHAGCDLVVGRYSYPLVAVCCPASRDQPAKLRCCHGGPSWVDRDWLRLLAAAYQSTDPLMAVEVKRSARSCWPWERLRRLRLELEIGLQVSGGGMQQCPRCRHPAHGDFCGVTDGINCCACSGNITSI